MNELQVIESHRIPDSAKRARLYDYANGLFQSIPSRKKLQKTIKEGRVLVNGDTGYTGTWVEPGMRLDLLGKNETVPLCRVEFDIVFEDPWLCVVNKPSGVPVSGNRRDTLRNALGTLFLSRGQTPPLAVHRLDLPTSGLVIFAKTADVAVDLGRIFENREVHKTYLCLAHGNMPLSGRILLPIEGRPAETRWKSLSYYQLKQHWFTLVEAYPLSGRKHQIRRHFSALGHTLAGDRQYGSALKGKGLFLHAKELRFVHPRTGENICLRVEEPGKFRRMREFLASKKTN